MSEEHTEQETHICRGCCGTEENEVTEPEATEPEDFEAEDLEAEAPETDESEAQEKITVATSMDLQGSHFIYTQTTDKSIKTLDYDYKRCNGCGICAEICQQKRLKWDHFMRLQPGLMHLL